MTEAWFAVELGCDCSPGEAIRRVLDFRAHTRLIPLTVVEPAVRFDELHAGFRFVARTGMGPVALDDVMLVEEIDGSSARIVKQGRVIRGSIHVRVEPVPGGSVLRWHQQVRLPWLPGFLQGSAAQVLRLGYKRVLRRLLEDAGPGSGDRS